MAPDIQGGRSADQTEAINDDRSTIYVVAEDTLTLASNFDKERDGQKPALECAAVAAPSNLQTTARGENGPLLNPVRDQRRGRAGGLPHSKRPYLFDLPFRFSSIAAWAAASRATGTR